MIKIENVITPTPEQMMFVVEGCRNPMNSWNKSDSEYKDGYSHLGDNDFSLMSKLARAGTDHRKFLRMMPVFARITAGHTFWAEFDTYKVGTVRNSCSKMHKIHTANFELDDFDHEGISETGDEIVGVLDTVRDGLNKLRDKYNATGEKKYWRAMIELLPMGFHMTANISLNYEVLANIYKSRRGHKMAEWAEFCNWIEALPYSELIIGQANS